MNYLTEWTNSCVDEQLIQLNVTPLDGFRPLDYLFYADTLPRRNDGRVSDGLLKRYKHLCEGGWWCSGVDILTGEDDRWGCFKPLQPRLSCDQGKPIKYEHPPNTPTGIFALKISPSIWQKISDRHQLKISVPQAEIDQAFWQWVIAHPEVPLWITEGAKKAGALLTAGYVAIALPGINNGYRVPKDEWGNRNGKPYLIPQLQKLATPKRKIYIAFDQDTKPNTIKAVDRAIKQLGYLLTQSGCSVYVVRWNSNFGKGIDDLIANQGQAALDLAYQTATPLETWKALSFNRLTYPATVEVNQRYLPDISIPSSAKLIAIKSPKGTGKTRLLESFVKTALDQGKWVLVIGHRVRLVEALCQRFGLNYMRKAEGRGVRAEGREQKEEGRGVRVEGSAECGVRSAECEVKNDLLSPVSCLLVSGSRAEGTEECEHSTVSCQLSTKQSTVNSQQSTSFGLCIDSLHPGSSVEFNATQWRDGVVILDEVEQVLWHGLNSETCRNHRVSILKSFKTLIQNVLGGKGQVIVADADLSDTSLDYLLSLGGVELQPYLIQNTWKLKPEEAWTVYNYSGKTPKELVKDLEQHIADGGKPFVCLSAQKLGSQWGTCTLESYLKTQFPQAKILRIDSESLADPTHPAYGCITRLNEVLPNYEIVLASPAIETGVSIEIPGHFTSVWGIAQGVQGENSVRQALGRVRDNIPRFLWVATKGFNPVGNGSTSVASLLGSGNRLTQLNIRLLQQSDFEGWDDLQMGFQAESLLCWAKMAVRFNAGMAQYRETVLKALEAEGYQIVQVPVEEKRKKPDKLEKSDSLRPTLTELISAVKDQNYAAECRAVAIAPNLDGYQYQHLQKQLIKTPVQRRSQRKYELKCRYGIPVTADLVEKDDQGWYQQLRIHYFLTVGRPYLRDRDAGVARKLLQQGEGSLFIPDFNRSQFGAMIGILELLGIPALLYHPERLLRNTDADLQQISAIALGERSAIKTILGIGLAQNSTPIIIIRRLLDKIGYGLDCISVERQGSKRIRVYRLVIPSDQREQVFQHWLQFEAHYPGCPTSSEEEFTPTRPLEQKQTSDSVEYIQLCLNF